MDGSSGSRPPAWGPKKSWAVPSSSSSPSTASSSREPTPSSSSAAFPPLSSPQVRRPSARPSASSYSSADSSLISSSSFNPYPTRRQELAQRAASHGTCKRSHITRSDPTTSRIHSLLDYDHDDGDDAVMHDLGDDDDDEGEVSSRGATMSSIVFRDLSASASASTSRSASPWHQPGLSAGLAMFATTTFGGEPLRVLANVDDELGAAHMGPRIYKRHNQKHVRNKVRAKIDAGHSVAPVLKSVGRVEVEHGRTVVGAAPLGVTAQEQDRLRSVDLQKLVDECRRCHTLSAIQARAASDDKPAVSSVDHMPALQTLLTAIRARIADPRTWTAASSDAVLSDDLLPLHLAPQKQQLDFSALPPSLLVQVRQSVLQGLRHLLDTILESTRQDLILTLSRLLSLRILRPTNTTTDADLKRALQETFLHLFDTFHRLPADSPLSPASLLSQVLAHMDREPGADALVGLVGELVGLCGQQMSSDPTMLTETQDSTLVSAASFLSLCFALNSTRPVATRLPAHAFYCTVLDLSPFLEHFVHHAASLVRSTTDTAAPAGMARFNVCRWPFLLSLGAKVRVLQLENEVRLARVPPRDSAHTQRFALPSSPTAELVVLPHSLNLKIEREHAWEQSKGLLLQLLDSATTTVQRGLRVEFAGEQAADGGGPAREWFATVASGWTADVRSVIGAHGWFVPPSDGEKDTEDTAAFLGLLLALAALHTTKLALPFTLPAAAFKIATAPELDALELGPVDLEFADSALAKSLQSVLDWTPAAPEEEADKVFDSTFSLTWSTTVRTASGQIQTIDLVPGGRHCSVKLAERREFVSRLAWRVVVGSVKGQVLAFREAWQSVVPSSWLAGGSGGGAESATELIGRGGLALSLFSAEEIGQAVLSAPSSPSVPSTPPDVGDIKGSTEIILPSSSTTTDVVDWFWTTWTQLGPLHQRRLLAFITGAEDLPATGARGIGLRIHLVVTEDTDARSWPLPWSSTCTSTLFLPVYPSQQLLRDKVGIAIEHYQGFGLR